MSDPIEIHLGCGGMVVFAHDVWRCKKCGAVPVPVSETRRQCTSMQQGPMKLEDIFSGHISLTARQRAYVAHALEELYLRGCPGAPIDVNRGDWHREVVRAVLGPLELTRMVTPDGTELVTPEEHRARYGKDVP